MMQQLTLRSESAAIAAAQQMGSWRECYTCKGIMVYRAGQLFAHIAVNTPLDDRRANRRMMDAAR